MWQQIARMQGLMNLDVRIMQTEGFLHHLDARDEERTLGPLFEVRRPRKYKVHVQWYLAEGERGREDRPFTEFRRGFV